MTRKRVGSKHEACVSCVYKYMCVMLFGFIFSEVWFYAFHAIGTIPRHIWLYKPNLWAWNKNRRIVIKEKRNHISPNVSCFNSRTQFWIVNSIAAASIYSLQLYLAFHRQFHWNSIEWTVCARIIWCRLVY